MSFKAAGLKVSPGNFLAGLSFLSPIILSVIAGGLLAFSFLDANLFFLTWFAFIPLLLAIEKSTPKSSFFYGLVFGLTFYPCAAYWVTDFLVLSKGYDLTLSFFWSSIFWLYCSLLPAFVCCFFTALKKRSSISEFVLFPVIVVTFYSSFPMLFTVQLGESQSRFLLALQAIELVGVYGLDVLIALSNMLVYRLIFPKQKRQIKSYVMSALLIFSWFSYGVYAQNLWQKNIETWPTLKVGLVQPNEEPMLDKLPIYKGYSRAFPPEMDMTGRLAESGAELVVWPEARYKSYFDQEHVRSAYQNEVSSLDVSVLFQDMEKVNYSDGSSVRRNVAALLDNRGELSGKYQKIKLVAFGEYVPLVSAFPMFKNLVEGFFGKFLNEVEPGSEHKSFTVSELNIVPLICYETMFPEFVAQAAKVTQSPDMLIGLSSNGWFGSTMQPYQHVYASVLRAVENRMPFVHVVNNGPSIVVSPTGEVIFETDYHQAGGYLVDVPYRARENIKEGGHYSLYQRYPYALMYSIYVIMFLLCLSYFRARDK